MCLIIAKPKGVIFSDDFIRNTYNKNSDGIGVMYAQNNVIHTAKQVPNRFEDVKAFWDKYIGDRECVIHFRMQTHGDVNLENAHPYEVLSEKDGYPLYLIHNGILHTKNYADRSKSDTWHYIQDYLRPMLLNNPTFFMTHAFKDIISEHIGQGNRFVLMDAYGNKVILNEETGVTYNNSWLSNTYAWDTRGTEHDCGIQYSKYTKGYSRGSSNIITNNTWNKLPATAPAPKDIHAEYEEYDDEYFQFDSFYDDFMDALVDHKLVRAEQELDYTSIKKFFEKDNDDAWTLIGMIEDGYYNDKQVIDEVMKECEEITFNE